MHSVSHICAHFYGICHVYCRQMRAYAWNGMHLTRISIMAARTTQNSCRKILVSIV